jgi:hypothetical protein
MKWKILISHYRLFGNFTIYNVRVDIWERKLFRLKINCTLLLALSLCTNNMADKEIIGLVTLFMTTALEAGEGLASCRGRSLS